MQEVTDKTEGMSFIPSGEFRMGSDVHYREEAPAHSALVRGFWIDKTAVTNRQFQKFVEATGHVTFAEIPPDPKDYPGALPNMLYAGSMVFTPTTGPVDLRNYANWWRFERGATWRTPYGANSAIDGLLDHPVVHVAYVDVLAYAAWVGKELPSETEWEFAARGGLDGAEYAWGDELAPGGKHLANTWQGRFPYENLAEDGFERTSPVGSYPANPYGLYDMIGNVWEWTTDWFGPRAGTASSPCCGPATIRRVREEESYDPGQPEIKIPRRVVKGGSHLCAPSYCRRYRPAARHAQAVDSSMSHVGFRLVVRA